MYILLKIIYSTKDGFLFEKKKFVPTFQGTLIKYITKNHKSLKYGLYKYNI